MHNEEHQNCTGGEPGQKATPNAKGGFVVIRDAIGLTASAIFAAIFFSTGHNVAGLWCSFVGLVSAFHNYFYYLAIKKPDLAVLIWGTYGWLIILMAIGFGVWTPSLLHPKMEPKPYPHFKFSLCVDNATDDPVELTNDFLIVTNSDTGYAVPGALCIPVQPGQSNVELSLMVQNDSSVTAEYTEVVISLTPNILCLPSAGWMKYTSKSRYGAVNRSGIVKPLKAQGLIYHVPTLLSGRGAWTPSIRIAKADEDAAEMTVWARAKHSPTNFVAAQIMFFIEPKSPENMELVHKPFAVVPQATTNGGFRFPIPWDKLMKLKQ
jgi:hypothetical protein